MANLLDNLGLGEFAESEEAMRYLLGTVVEEGKSIPGYSDVPYIRKTFKCAEIIARLTREEEGYAVSGIDTHCSGNMIWDAVIQNDITPEDADPGERKVLISTCEYHGLAVVNLVDADVLPSFLAGDRIRMQMVGIPVFLDIYENEEEMADAHPESAAGEKIILADGVIFPGGFFRNHNPDHGSCENSPEDDINLIRGTIKRIYGGDFEIEGERCEPFLKFIIDTQFGELEIDAGKETVRTACQATGKSEVRVGMTILAGVYLSGDVAIYDYNDGKIRDEEHDLRAIRQTICKGEPGRIRSILSEDCRYVSNVGRWDVTGRDPVVGIFDQVTKAHDWMYTAHLAMLLEPRDPNSAELLRYKPGKRCLILGNERKEYESIMLIEHDENGDINRIEVTNDSRYVFRIDEASVM